MYSIICAAGHNNKVLVATFTNQMIKQLLDGHIQLMMTCETLLSSPQAIYSG